MKKVYSKNFVSKFLSILLIFLLTFVVLAIKMPSVKAANTYTQTLKSGIESFPESYQVLLNKFVEETAHDNWNFQAYYTGMDWNEYIQKQSVCGQNRVHTSFDTAHRHSCNNLASGYYCANPQLTAYFIDPRNFINERNLFQFLELSYNKDLYTKEMVEELIKGLKVFNNGNPITFTMSDKNHKDYGKSVTMTFADIIMDAAEQSQMSPISIVSKIKQEVGANGSGSTSGNHTEYPGCYNYFNIGAYDSGDAIRNGLKYASENGWNCPYSSIVGGAKYNSKNYIQIGQNTLYSSKFDYIVGGKILKVNETVTADFKGLHQYMTNVVDPYTQTYTYKEAYTNNGLLNKSLNFIIPVFNNMPESTIKPSSLLGNDNVELYYADISSTCITRTGPGTNYPNVSGVSVLYKDDFVIMLERETAYNNGLKWDKVQFWNGEIGYVASEYLSKFNSKPGDSDPDPNEPKIIGYGYANVSSSLNVRLGPGTGYKTVASLGAKEEFGIIEETPSWTKIKTNSGVIGYVTNEYVVKIDKTPPSDNGKIKLENNTIKIIPEITANEVGQFLENDSYTVKNGNTIITNGILGTGYKFIANGKEYTIVKMGDVNGDCEVNMGDAFLIQRYAMKLVEIKNEFLLASDINKDNEVNTADAFFIQRYVMKLWNIAL